MVKEQDQRLLIIRKLRGELVNIKGEAWSALKRLDEIEKLLLKEVM